MTNNKIDIGFISISLLSALYKYIINDSSSNFGFLLLITAYLALKVGIYIFKIKLPAKVYLSIISFIFFALILGNIFKMYEIIPQWDLYLHLISGVVLVPIGLLIFEHLYGSNDYKPKLAIFFIIAFTIACAGLWEMHEFLSDTILKLNSQGGSLVDTMTDIIAGTVGGIIMTIITFWNRKRVSIKK